MIGHDDVLVAACLRGRHETIERVAPVRPVRVRVQVTAQVGRRHERRNSACARGFDLAAVLAELRRKPRQADRSVDVLFRRTSHPRAGALVEHAVLAEAETFAHGDLAHSHVVLLRAGEVLQRCAEGVRLHDAQIDAQPRVVKDRRARRPMAEHLDGGGQRRERPHHARGRVRGHEDVDVLHRFPAPADGSRDLDAVDAAVRPQDVHDLRGDGAGDVERCARAAPSPRGDALEDVVARLLSHAADAEDDPGAARLLEALDGIDAEALVERARGLGTEAADFEQGGEGRRQLAAQRFEIGHAPGREVFRDSGRELASDARQRLQAAACGDDGHVLPERLQRLRGALVGADAEPALLTRVEQRGDLVEKPRNLEVFHTRHGTLAAS